MDQKRPVLPGSVSMCMTCISGSWLTISQAGVMLKRSVKDAPHGRGRLPKWAATGWPRGVKTTKPESWRWAPPCRLPIWNSFIPSGTKKYQRRGTVTVCMSKVSWRPFLCSQSPQSITICARVHSNHIR